MAISVTFQSRVDIPGTVAYQVWSYQVSGSGQELAKDLRVALALPVNIDVRQPSEYPGMPQLAGTFVERDQTSSRQYVGRTVVTAGSAVISFVAPSTPAESACEVLLVKAPSGQGWVSQPFTTTGTTPSHVQNLPAPRSGPAVFTGRPLGDFRGTLPYASEVMGIYQPLIGWLGALSTMRAAQQTDGAEKLSLEAFRKSSAYTLEDESLAKLAERAEDVPGALSPVGTVNLFRQYFFEFDTFLGPPTGHVWISPGGTVELVETSTRRTLVEKVSEQAEETSRKTEESFTEQDDVADAVKESNANDTKLGVSATGGVNAGIYHAEASANLSTQSMMSKASEATHKRSRTQSAKVTSEIKRNYKTTFRTVTETTDTSSRRYVVQNTSQTLVNYELRRKMRKVGVQVQHIGQRLCWQVYLPDPGRRLALGEMVHAVAAPDVTALKKPTPPPPLKQKTTEFTGNFPILKYPGTKDWPDKDENADFVFLEFPPNTPEHRDIVGLMSYDRAHHIIAEAPFTADLPAPGYKLVSAAVKGAKSEGKDCKFIAENCHVEDAANGKFKVIAKYLNVGDLNSIQVTFTLQWNPPSPPATPDAPDYDPERTQYLADLAEYERQVASVQREAYTTAVRERLKLVSALRPRPSDDLRSEERHIVYGELIDKLHPHANDYYNSELLRQAFEVEEMLYYVAPDYWRPGQNTTPGSNTVGRYPVPRPPWTPRPDDPNACWVEQLPGQTVSGWYTHTDRGPNPEEQSHPAPTAAKAPDTEQTSDAADPAATQTGAHATPPCTVDEEWRANYLVTEETQPAPLGSSLGWHIQIDADERRNEFLNAAWVKAVLPIRPGHEEQAIEWLLALEGVAGLGRPYQQGDEPAATEGAADTDYKEALRQLATAVQQANGDLSNTVASEKVFETGFDPLAGGFRPATEPYQIFDQWVEVLPTDQVVAVQVTYDPKTGQQL
jgi:hypothetical protein